MAWHVEMWYFLWFKTMDFWCGFLWYANMHRAFLFSVCCVYTCVLVIFLVFQNYKISLWFGVICRHCVTAAAYFPRVSAVLNCRTAVSLSIDSHGMRKWVSVTAMVYTCMQLHKHNFQPKLPPTQPLILAKSVSSHLSFHFHTKHK